MADRPPSPAPTREAPAPEREGDRVRGILFVVKDGYGFLRQAKSNYIAGPGDVYVPKNVIQKWRIRSGSEVEGVLGRGRRGKKKRPLEVVLSINGNPPEQHARTRHWKEFTSVDPNRRIRLEVKAPPPEEAPARARRAPPVDVSLRIVDLVMPIGFGQRVLIVGPPRAGKTVLMQKMANAIAENHPNAKVLILLVDERPEEVTDYRRTVPKAEVIASSLDLDPSDHVAVSEVVLDRARRLTELGNDVVLFIDSLTRMARAFNVERGRSGRTMTGGLDSAAMQKPREIFGAGRFHERGGSLTVIAAALVDTGSKLDQLVHEEFKGTGNAELHLVRELADKRIFPAIDVKPSGTRKEEKLRPPEELKLVNAMRRGLARQAPQKAIELLLERARATQNNAEFIAGLAKAALL